MSKVRIAHHTPGTKCSIYGEAAESSVSGDAFEMGSFHYFGKLLCGGKVRVAHPPNWPSIPWSIAAAGSSAVGGRIERTLRKAG
jgi:hypothetical protein